MTKISQNHETELWSLWSRETKKNRKLHLSYKNILEDSEAGQVLPADSAVCVCACTSMPVHMCFGSDTKLESLSLLLIHSWA